MTGQRRPAGVTAGLGAGRTIIRQPAVVTVAGSDSGGGAGIQADLKTFMALSVHGTSVVTALTAQNPAGVAGIQAASADFVRLQLEAVFEAFEPRVMKTGMLCSPSIVQTVAEFVRGKRGLLLVVDPVMMATSRAALLSSRGLRTLIEQLLPSADLITPNMAEAEVLAGKRVRNLDQARDAADLLHRRFGCAVLVKGGHLRGREKTDVLHCHQGEALFVAPSVASVQTHGTGCTLAAAIAAYRARGFELRDAVGAAKKYVTAAIRGGIRVGAWAVLNHSTSKGQLP